MQAIWAAVEDMQEVISWAHTLSADEIMRTTLPFAILTVNKVPTDLVSYFKNMTIVTNGLTIPLPLAELTKAHSFSNLNVSRNNSFSPLN